MSASLNALLEIANRYAGCDIQFRRDIPVGWKGSWRVRLLTSKNERDEYRLTEYGDNLDAAIESLLKQLPVPELQNIRP